MWLWSSAQDDVLPAVLVELPHEASPAVAVAVALLLSEVLVQVASS